MAQLADALEAVVHPRRRRAIIALVGGLGGAALALTAVDFLEEIDGIRDRITYLELNVNQEFMNRFSAAKFLPHTNASLFPSVIVWGKNRSKES